MGRPFPPRTIRAALDELQAGRRENARRALQALLTDEDRETDEFDLFAAEIDDLLRVGLDDEASRRLTIFLTPKFSSVDACSDAYRKHMEP